MTEVPGGGPFSGFLCPHVVEGELSLFYLF